MNERSRPRHHERKHMTTQTNAIKIALEAYMAAGFGNSTNFALQGKAYDLAVEALAEQHPDIMAQLPFRS